MSTIALFGRTRQALLAHLFTRPDEKFYLRELARLTKSGLGAVQREVRQLTEVGILVRTKQGKEVYFQADPSSPIFHDLKSLMIKTAGVAEVLRNDLKKLRTKVSMAFVFGSMAKAEPRAGSDIDVLVVGEVSLAEVLNALERSRDLLAREINPTVYPPDEFRTKIASGNHFLQTVLKEPKIFLLGNENELRRLATERLAQKP